MKINLLFFVFLIQFLFSGFVFGQNINPADEIKKTLSPEDLTALQESENNLLSAETLAKSSAGDFEKAQDLRAKSSSQSKKEQKKMIKDAGKNEKNGFKSYEKASLIFEKSYKTEYNIYKKNLNVLADNADSDKKQNIVDSQKDASDAYKKSMSDRNKASRAKTPEEKYSLLKSSDESGKSAIEIEIKTFDDYYGWTTIKKNTEVIPVKTDSVSVKKTISDTTIITETNENSYDANKPDKTKDNKVVPPINTENLTFRIQIAASKNTLPVTKLKQIYPGSTQINNEKDGEYYKYTVGECKSYEEAWNLKKSMNVSGAFVVAYRSGKRTDLRQSVSPDEFNKMNGGSGVVVKSANSSGIEFRLQIGMSRLPADDLQLKKINPTSETVNTYDSGQFYKYTIGSFSSEQEALNYKNSNNKLRKAIVVKYSGGKEIK
jgi:hypothetical protein